MALVRTRAAGTATIARKVLATLFERRREGVVTSLNAVVAVDERVFVEVTGPRTWGVGASPGDHACMVVTVRDGRIVRMQAHRAAALAAPASPERARWGGHRGAALRW